MHLHPRAHRAVRCLNTGNRDFLFVGAERHIGRHHGGELLPIQQLAARTVHQRFGGVALGRLGDQRHRAVGAYRRRNDRVFHRCIQHRGLFILRQIVGGHIQHRVRHGFQPEAFAAHFGDQHILAVRQQNGVGIVVLTAHHLAALGVERHQRGVGEHHQIALLLLHIQHTAAGNLHRIAVPLGGKRLIHPEQQIARCQRIPVAPHGQHQRQHSEHRQQPQPQPQARRPPLFAARLRRLLGGGGFVRRCRGRLRHRFRAVLFFDAGALFAGQLPRERRRLVVLCHMLMFFDFQVAFVRHGGHLILL